MRQESIPAGPIPLEPAVRRGISQGPPPPSKSLLRTIGNTPLIELQKVVSPGAARVLVKLESFNPTASYKDRMALAMIEEAEARGDLRPGMTVLEYTGGSTGSSLAFVCAFKGYRLRIVSSDAFAKEKLRTMEAFGAELTLVPSLDGKITPDLAPRMIKTAEKMAQDEGVYWTNQLHNRDSLKGYEAIGRELLQQMESPIDVFCASVGTAGMLMAVSRVLKEADRRTRVVALEPASAAVISTGRAGTHHVEGIGIGFVPPLFDRSLVDETRTIEEGEARQMARRLAREEGLFAGTSSALNIVAAIQIARQLGADRTVVTVAVDSGLKYLGGDLYNSPER